MRNAHKVIVGIPEGRRPIVKPKRTWEEDIKKQGVRVWSGFIWLKIEFSDWCSRRCNESSGFIKSKNFLE
jgi:hypothetical protein